VKPGLPDVVTPEFLIEMRNLLVKREGEDLDKSSKGIFDIPAPPFRRG